MASVADDDYIALPYRFRNVPLEALRVSVRRKLSLYLNLERLLNDAGIVPDYNGLAEMIGFSFLEIQNFGRLQDPTSEVLNEWTSRPDMNPTVGRLFEYLQKMGRIDVLTDCKPNILSDIDHYLAQQERRQESVQPLQDDTISQSCSTLQTDHNVNETAIMTTDDVENRRPTYYDAFVCYDPEGYDLQFVKKMIFELESPRYDLKLFVPWRNDLPGASAYTVSAKLIQERCRRMVIIMSPRYLNSPSCDFQTKFAHSLSPGSRSKKLVPVLIVPCHIPQILRHVTLCDFTKRDLMEWFWVRLARAISAPLDLTELQINESIPLEQITLDLDLQHGWSSSSSSGSQPVPIAHSRDSQFIDSSPMECGSGSGNSMSELCTSTPSLPEPRCDVLPNATAVQSRGAASSAPPSMQIPSHVCQQSSSSQHPVPPQRYKKKKKKPSSNC